MKKLEHISPLRSLTVIILLSAIPFLMVELFKTNLYTVMDITSYLAFHNVAEFFSIMVSFSIFGLGWYAYDQNNDRHSLFLSVAFLTIGLLDFMHTLGYSGMPPFMTPNSPNKSTQFWIAARLLGAASFLSSAFILPNSKSRWLSKAFLLTASLSISAATFISVSFFPDLLPATYIQGVGLTPFKKISEYIIIGMLAYTSAIYWRQLLRTGNRLHIYYIAAFVICIFSELVFAIYKSVFDTYNVIGHIYKIFAFCIIYKGIFIASVRKPYEYLNKSHSMLSHIINTIPQSLFWKDKESVYLGCNENFARRAGFDKAENLVGLSDFDLAWSRKEAENFRDDDRAVMERAEAKNHIIETQR